MTHRNWTHLQNHLIIDTKGLITPLNGKWSLDHYLRIQSELILPAKSVVTQDLNPVTGVISSEFRHQDIRCVSRVSIEGVEISLTNAGNTPQTFELIIAIKPYNSEEIASIRELVFLNNKVMINGQLGIILDEKPDNIVFVNASDGDSCDHIGKWDKILSTKCALGLATGHLQYSVNLPANQTQKIGYKLSLGNISPTLLEPKMTVSLPDPKIQYLYETSVFHLLNSRSNRRNILLALQHLGFGDMTKQLLPDTPESIGLYWSQHTYYPDTQLLADTFTKTCQWVKTLERQLNSLDTQPLADTLWALWGIRSAKEIAHSLMNLEKQKQFASLEIQFLDAFQKFLTQYFERLRAKPFLLVHPESAMGSNMVKSLASVQALKLLHPNDPLIDETLRLLEEEFMINGVLFHNQTLDGYPVSDNTLLAQTYVQRKDAAKAFGLLNWIMDHANPTGSFPENIHPVTHGGSSGDGHYIDANAQFCELVRSMLIQEETDHLHLFPLIPEAWLTSTQPISIKNAPTQWGLISFSLQKKANSNEFSLTIEPEFQKGPREIWVSLPQKIASVTSPQGTIKLTSFSTFVMPPHIKQATILLAN